MAAVADAARAPPDAAALVDARAVEARVAWEDLSRAQRARLGTRRAYALAAAEHTAAMHLPLAATAAAALTTPDAFCAHVVAAAMADLMPYPYHYEADLMSQARPVTPLAYYKTLLEDLLAREAPFDAMSNFAASDCWRTVGVGRNEYIALSNELRASWRWRVTASAVRARLPERALRPDLAPWWLVRSAAAAAAASRPPADGKVAMYFAQLRAMEARAAAVRCADVGCGACEALHDAGLAYFAIPLAPDSRVFAAHLTESFVMNRAPGAADALLYRVLVSVDRERPLREVAALLGAPLQLVVDAVSLLLRLALVRPVDHANAWDIALLPPAAPAAQGPDAGAAAPSDAAEAAPASRSSRRRVGVLCDSSVVSALMIGNFGAGLKAHAMTLFEVGRLSGAAFLAEFGVTLLGRDIVAEGDAQSYLVQATALRSTLLALSGGGGEGEGVDVEIVRCESLEGLAAAARGRLLAMYALVIPVLPLAAAAVAAVDRVVRGGEPLMLGGPPLLRSAWFDIALADAVGAGLPTVLLPCGIVLRQLPLLLCKYSHFCVCRWDASEGVVVTRAELLLAVAEILSSSAVVVTAVEVGAHGVAPPSYCVLRECSGSGGDVVHGGRVDVQTVVAEVVDPELLSRVADVIDTALLGYLELAVAPLAVEPPAGVPRASQLVPRRFHCGVPIFDAALNAAVCGGLREAGDGAADYVRGATGVVGVLDALVGRVAEFIRRVSTDSAGRVDVATARALRVHRVPHPATVVAFDGRVTSVLDRAAL